MEMYGKIRCVTYRELVGGGILSIPSYKKKVRDGVIQVVQRGGNGREAMIGFDSLPTPLRNAYLEKHPDAEKRMKEQLISNIMRTDSKAIRFYKEYQPAISAEQQDKYVLHAQVMNEMIRVEKEMEAAQKKCGYLRKGVIWETVQGTCEKLRTLYGHTLPTSARLRDKYNAYKRTGYVALINQNSGNQAARKIGPDEARLLLKLKRSKFPIYTDAQIFKEYNCLVEEHNQSASNEAEMWKPIKSLTSVRNYLNEPAVMPLWYGAVYGMQKWKQKYCSQLKTELPQMRDALWYGDGTKLNLYYKNEQGKMCTTSVYEVIDVYSEVLLGYDIAPNENFDNQYRAYRMAIETAQHRPYEIVTDNQGGHSKAVAQGFFAKLTALHKPTMPYNGQSKTIENAFYRFQAQVLHQIWYFTGQNVTTKKLNSKPNLEFIEQNAYALPTLVEVKEIYRQCREEWNGMAHPETGVARIDMYRMSENPETPVVTQTDIVRMFWLKNPKTVTYTAYGLQVEINKKKYHYDVYAEDGLRNEPWALRNTGRAFHVLYDPMDMTHIELWEPTASGMKFSTGATPKVTISRATQERTSEQTSFMRRTIDRSKEIMAATQLTMEDFDLSEGIAVELFGLSTPKPKNVSQKQMDAARAKQKSGTLNVPVSLPEKQEQEENEIDLSLAYSSTGEYTKEISNLSWEDVALDRF